MKRPPTTYAPDAPALKPRPRLLATLSVALALWIILLIVIYFTVVR